MEFLKKFFLLCLILTLILPSQLLAQNDIDEYIAKGDAKRAAKKKVSTTCWYGAGLTVVGVGIAMIWKIPSPDPAVFMGKSPQYVKAYTEQYKKRVKDLRITYSMRGCFFTVILGGIILIAPLFNSCLESTYNCVSPDPSSSCAGPN